MLSDQDDDDAPTNDALLPRSKSCGFDGDGGCGDGDDDGHDDDDAEPERVRDDDILVVDNKDGAHDDRAKNDAHDFKSVGRE